MRFFLALLSAFLIVVPFSSSLAQEENASVEGEFISTIAVVDIRKILQESEAAKSVDKQLSEQQEKYQKEFDELEDKLIKQEKKLVDEKDDLSNEDFLKRRDELENEVMEIRELAKTRKRIMEEAFNRALITLKEEIIKIAATLAEKRGYELILNRQDVVIAVRDMDITDEVMKKINKSLPKVELTFSEE